jgi:hypothetical protein
MAQTELYLVPTGNKGMKKSVNQRVTFTTRWAATCPLRHRVLVILNVTSLRRNPNKMITLTTPDPVPAGKTTGVMWRRHMAIAHCAGGDPKGRLPDAALSTHRSGLSLSRPRVPTSDLMA